MQRKVFFFLCILLYSTGYLPGQNFSSGFSFNLPPDDSTTQVFLPTFPVGNIQSFIDINADGHFTSEGIPIRFWGVNTTTYACFPEKSKSSFIAARMRKMGINLVRFHHMDNGWTANDGTIFLRNSQTTRQLDPTAMDRLFFFLSEMKKNQVYANINLHVSRTFREADGVLNADSIWQFGKGVTMFDPQLIQLQKEFARQLLTAQNPYTGLSMINDPVIAMVEISNENTLYGMWKGDQLKPFAQGGDLMQRHSDLLDSQWQQFLQNKYNTDEALEAAWGGAESTAPTNLLMDGGFESGTIDTHWKVELFEGAQATIGSTTSSARTGNYAGKVDVTKVTSTDWHIQFKQTNLSLQKDSAYVLEFYAKADRNRAINAGIQRDGPPHTWYGGQGFNLSTEWQRFRFSITAPEDIQSQVKITFNFASEAGSVWFDDLVFSRPQITGLGNGEKLSSKNIQRIDYSSRLSYHSQRVADMAEFYLEIQRTYFKEMYDFLVDELGVQVPITGTNALVGPSDVYTQQDLDFIDDHAYWDHPRFPSVAWSSTDWYIDNESMLEHESLGTISNLFAGQAMQGKPYTISEYNHAYPNRYQLEMLPILASYASFHNADGLMFFDYNGDREWEADYIDGYFSLHRNNTLMSMFPLYAYAYRKHMISAAAEAILVDYSPKDLFRISLTDNNGRWGKFFPYDRKIALEHTIRTVGFAAETSQLPNEVVDIATPQWTQSEEVGWNRANQFHVINTAKIQSITGELSSLDVIPLDHLQVLDASDAGVITWISLEEASLPASGYSLLAINSRIQNTNTTWDGTTTVRDQWGSAPTEILPLQVNLELEIAADFINLFPLDVRGAHSNDNYFTVWPNEAGKFVVSIDQEEYSSPWFGIQAVKSTPTSDPDLVDFKVQLSPNPANEIAKLTFALDELTPFQIKIFNLQGSLVFSEEKNQLIAGEHQHLLDISSLPSGAYIINLIMGNKIWSEKLVKE